MPRPERRGREGLEEPGPAREPFRPAEASGPPTLPGTHPTGPEEEASRPEEAKVSYRTILEREIGGALREFERPASGLLISSFSAGLDIGFGPLLMAVMATLFQGNLSPPTIHLLLSALYPIGFVFVILGRSELFTEHTAMAVLPVLARRANTSSLLRLWGLVYAGNLAGAAIFAYLVALVAPALGIVDPAAFRSIAAALVEHSPLVILASGVLAGWLMGLLSWLLVASRETISQIVVIFLVTGAIGIAGLHHSIAGTVEVLFGVFGAGIAFDAFVSFLVLTTVGNAIGGSVFVAALKYGHAVRSRPEHVGGSGHGGA